MKNLIIIALALGLSFISFAGISDGMQEELPLTHVQDNDYLEFHNFRTRPRAPIAAGIKINDQPVRSLEEIFSVFSEEVAAVLPEGQTIKESTDSEGRIVWRYPIGTKVIHQLNFKNDKKSLFELRMIERVSNKRWAFGVYHPIEGKLKLANYPGRLPKEFNLRTHDGKPLNIKLSHIPLNVCQNCHNNTTSAPHQYESRIDVGPCEFTPTNPNVKDKWVKEFISAFGRKPVTKTN